MSYVVVLVTSKDTVEAEKIARSVVEKKLAACCNIVKDVRSIYQWEDKLTETTEAMLVIKTRRDALPALEHEIKSLHSYKVPEIISLSILGGSEEYLKWLGSCIGKG
jgi:periplasmic divalent cation tolerance protein